MKENRASVNNVRTHAAGRLSSRKLALNRPRRWLRLGAERAGEACRRTKQSRNLGVSA
jgi:hypothetical protein